MDDEPHADAKFRSGQGSGSILDDGGAAPHTGAFFSHSRNFIVAGGVFTSNTYIQPALRPSGTSGTYPTIGVHNTTSDHRKISEGDSEMYLQPVDGLLGRMYSARVSDVNSEMPVGVHQEDKEWRQLDISKYQAKDQDQTLSPAPSKFLIALFIFLGALGILTLLSFASISASNGSLNYYTPYALCSSYPSKVYTVDSNNGQTQCVLVDNGYILSAGTLAEVWLYWHNIVLRSEGVSYSTLQIRYIPSGSIVVQGPSDAHGHFLEYGATQQLTLEGTKNIMETVARVRNYILADPDIRSNTSTYVLGGGWDHTAWPTNRWPTAADLNSDPVLRGRPIILRSKDCHALWVSDKVIEVSSPFPDVIEGGVVVRDDSGHPNGMFLGNAQDIIVQPEITEDDTSTERRFSVVQEMLFLGLTSVHDAGLNPMSLPIHGRF